MKKLFTYAIPLTLVLLFILYLDEIILLFKDEQGITNWQYVANWSSGILIILLSITAIFLFFSRRSAHKANRELEAIKNELEERVKERTANLKQANLRLQEEIEQHLATTRKLHASEHYLASILSSMPSMLVGLNENREVTQWNKKAEEYTGIAFEDAIGRNLWEVYPIITITPQQVEEALAQQEIKTIRQSQRGLFHFDITIYPLTSDHEPGVVLLLDDVSQQVESENKLIQRDKISAMGELASAMAHDINVPLKGLLENIHRFEEALAKSPTSTIPAAENLNQSIKQALAQGQQVSAIVENLLEFAGARHHHKQKVAITELMDHTLELAQNVLSETHGLRFAEIAIDREYDQNVPAMECHLAELQQVFLRLLRHAFHSLAKVEEEGFEPRIRIRILECYESIWVKISHNGVGLSGEQQQSIFEPYFSNQPADSEYDADMRLSFSYFVVTEHHDGQMAVTSDPKIGTTFHMQFRVV